MNRPIESPTLAADPRLETLYRRPGFLIRRAHQIAMDMFIEACAPVDMTPSQYGVLYILQHIGPLSQIGVARLIGLDRSTAALVVKLLTERGHVMKAPSALDARKVEIAITPAGSQVLKQAAKLANREMKQLLAPFSESEGQMFLSLLEKFVAHHNDTTRVSIVGRSDA
ncbi:MULTISPECIES: MarR family winged helix-turn-helix transcriptional regulator [Cupriavidus]|uniref:MarR family transcriptional regulator n=2 Tax=Cupriavidus TaxID=106589 RepID=A0A316EZ66_9BURK|nr:MULTISPECIES: MarR family transcriptional regulator [Cupriavidus]NYI00160.1 DNA-binding MarR family transcriptional regulator [Cupriavidus plantarum]PWK37342.1 MarR family transcriptional regulator [Cupriavidus plantarum]QET01696.1 MarR family transcriptional regulator [Cupriavidus pauculus]REF01914.1 MarR family transcriptional regulator [Cupriavidus plantarum]RLK45234.1 MarR family transcriptional regulator [Cupriavidus plantarum]